MSYKSKYSEILHEGKKQSLEAWSEELGIDKMTLYKRLSTTGNLDGRQVINLVLTTESASLPAALLLPTLQNMINAKIKEKIQFTIIEENQCQN